MVFPTFTIYFFILDVLERFSMSDSQIPNESKGLLAEFIDFIVHNKAWWMTPIILVLILMVGFIIFLDSSPILPFIYTVI